MLTINVFRDTPDHPVCVSFVILYPISQTIEVTVNTPDRWPGRPTTTFAWAVQAYSQTSIASVV
jgi:hypothetical protein